MVQTAPDAHRHEKRYPFGVQRLIERAEQREGRGGFMLEIRKHTRGVHAPCLKNEVGGEPFRVAQRHFAR